MSEKFQTHIPSGPIENRWEEYKKNAKLVNPANKRKFNVIVVGTGLAGASAAASLAELGYNVQSFCIQDSPRRAHSIAAQGGINAAKNYPNDGDSVYRLFYDTVKGGDFRARESNVYRLAEISNNIIDQCVAQGVPFARDYGGFLDNRSFGGAQVSRTFYARGQTGQQLLLGAYSAMMKQVNIGKVKLFPRTEMLELVTVKGRARGIVCRHLISGEIKSYTADAVVLATGGYGNVFYLSTNAMNSNATASWRCHKKGALFANPCFTQIHPTCIPVSGSHQSKLTLMSESLRNDGRVWIPLKAQDKRSPNDIPEEERDYYLERIYPSFGNLVPRDVASRQAKFRADEDKGVGSTGQAVYLDFKDVINNLGKENVASKYGNLFQMYEKITGENPYKTPMKIYPAVHYTMGGLWVDYDLQSNVKGLFVLGEANFSDHGSNRLGASALMQGLADGYFIIPYSIGNYLAGASLDSITSDNEAFKEEEKKCSNQINKFLKNKGSKPVDFFHKKLGKILWDKCGISREEKGLESALVELKQLKEEFEQEVLVPSNGVDKNSELEKAGRVFDFFELGQLMCLDALHRKESCGGHFREEHQSPENEALRDDENFSYVACWEYEKSKWNLHKESLSFEYVTPTKRSYK